MHFQFLLLLHLKKKESLLKLHFRTHSRRSLTCRTRPALSRQWLTVIIVSPIPCKPHCGCNWAPLRFVPLSTLCGVCLVLVDGSHSRFSLPLAPTLSRASFSLRLSPPQLAETAYRTARLTCLLNFLLSPPPQFLRSRDEALVRDRKREENEKSRLAKEIRCRACNNEMFNQ